MNARTLEQLFFPLSLLGAVVTVALVIEFVDPTIGIRGGYAVIGLLLGAIIHYSDGPQVSWSPNGDVQRWSAKGVYVLALVSIAVTALTDRRLFVLLTFVPLGYLLLAHQLRAGRSVLRLLPQVMALFSVPPLTKYLTTGFYFGNGDLLFHVLHVEQLLTRGTTTAIRGAGSQYQAFPGLHLLVGNVRLFSSLSPYDSLLVSGVLTYVMIVIPLMYLLSQSTFRQSDLAFFIAVGTSFVYSISFHTTYLFPQSLAVPLLLFVLFLTYRAANASTPLRIGLTTVTFFLLTGALFVHHLSFLILTPIVILLGTTAFLLRRIAIPSLDRIAFDRPQFLPLFAGWMAALTYWTVALESFIFNTVWWANQILSDLLSTPTPEQASRSIIAFGRDIPERTAQDVVANLASVNSLYLIALTAVFALGIVSLLHRHNEFRRATPMIVVGIVSALLVLKTPVVFPGLDRIRMPFAFFFAAVLGVGVYKLIRATRTRSLVRFVAIFLFLLLATTAPMYVRAGDDLYGLHDPPAGPPQKQVEFSAREYNSLAEAADFSTTHEIRLQTFWLDSLALARFQGRLAASPSVTDNGVRGTDGLFLYRRGWTKHLVHYSGDTWGQFILSDEWLTENVRRQNKVYDSGRVGMLWTDTDLRLPRSVPTD